MGPRWLPGSICLTILMGGLVAATLGPVAAGSETAGALQGQAVDVDVRLWDTIAVTRVSLVVDNPSSSATEAAVRSPLSPTAVLTNFTLTTHNRTLFGVVLERTAAQTQYNASRSAGQTAVLLTSAGQGLLSLTVNVAAKETILLNLTYVEALPVESGVQTYRFPLGELVAPYGEIARLHVTARMESARGWSDIQTTGLPQSAAPTNGAHASLDYSTTNVTGLGDLVFRLKPTASEFTSTLALSGRAANATAVFSLLPPGFGAAPLPLDMVLILDRSGSMSGTKIDQARVALGNILDQLRPADRFGLVSFSDSVTAYHTTLSAVNPSNLAAAHDWVSGIRADGSTDIEGAVSNALSMLGTAESASLPTIVLVTDGQPTAGITDPRAIIDSVAGKNRVHARIHTVGIGFDREDSFLTELATSNRGFYQPVAPSDNVTATLDGFYERISTPVLKNVHVQFEGIGVSQVQPDPLPDLYQGLSLVVAGRANTSQLPPVITAVVSGTAPDGPASYRLAMNTSSAPVVPEADRIWVRLKASALERRLELSHDDQEQAQIRAQLLVLGLAYQVETRVTAWLIVDQPVSIDEVGNRVRDAAPFSGVGAMPPAPPPAFPPGPPGAAPTTASLGAQATKTPGLAAPLCLAVLVGAARLSRRR